MTSGATALALGVSLVEAVRVDVDGVDAGCVVADDDPDHSLLCTWAAAAPTAGLREGRLADETGAAVLRATLSTSTLRATVASDVVVDVTPPVLGDDGAVLAVVESGVADDRVVGGAGAVIDFAGDSDVVRCFFDMTGGLNGTGDGFRETATEVVLP